MELCAGTEERPFDCDYCDASVPPSLVNETRRLNERTGKYYWDKQCPKCAQEEADCKAADREAAKSIRPELEALAAKCGAMSRDDIYEALQALSLRMAA